MVDGGDAAAVPLTGLTGALIASLGSSGAPAPRRGAHFESLPRTLRPARLTPQIACALNRCAGPRTDRKSTRLNSSHLVISYAVFCLKKKKKSRDVVHEPCPQQYN